MTEEASKELHELTKDIAGYTDIKPHGEIVWLDGRFDIQELEQIIEAMKLLKSHHIQGQIHDA